MSTDNPTKWWHSDKPARHILRHEDGSEVELSEDDLDAMMRRWDQVVSESESDQQRVLNDQELAAEIVALLHKRAKNNYAAYGALAQAAVDYDGALGLVLFGGSMARVLHGGEL